MTEKEKQALEYLEGMLTIYKDIPTPISQKALEIIVNLIKKQQKEIEELEQYDYRKIKIEEKNKISSIHFTKEQLDLMNLGIALYVGIPKMLADIEDEETDI